MALINGRSVVITKMPVFGGNYRNSNLATIMASGRVQGVNDDEIPLLCIFEVSISLTFLTLANIKSFSC